MGKGSAMKAMYTCPLEMEKKVATMKKEKGLPSKSNAELVAFVRW